MGKYADSAPTYAVNGAEVEKMMREYKSPFIFRRVCADKNTWLIGLGSALAFMAVKSYIASAIPAMLGCGYDYGFATTIFAVGGVMGTIGSFLFGLVD